jgi:hypothetical protein
MITGRLLPNTDLIQGLKSVCIQNNVQYGQIISCIGSLKKASYVYATNDIDDMEVVRYSQPVIVEGPIELINSQGTIGQENGKISIHLHGTLGDKKRNICGGHFFENGNTVLATVEFLIMGCNSPSIVRKFDDETGFVLFRYTAE